jgi:hypothetical protein
MEMHIWMSGKPAVVLGLVRVQVVEDDMNLPLRMRGENAIHEIEELDAPAAAVMPGSNFACCDVESGE